MSEPSSQALPFYFNPHQLAHRSDAVVWNGVAYVSGAVPHDGSTDIADQTRQVLAQIDEWLKGAGTDKSKLLFAMVWMVDVNRDVAAFNKAWSEWLGSGPKPARACVQSALQGAGAMEVAVVAAVTNG
jgi:enamine deaminase RidA (YjgF/YER057c/UK114 family)